MLGTYLSGIVPEKYYPSHLLKNTFECIKEVRKHIFRNRSTRPFQSYRSPSVSLYERLSPQYAPHISVDKRAAFLKMISFTSF